MLSLENSTSRKQSIVPVHTVFIFLNLEISAWRERGELKAGKKKPTWKPENKKANWE
jgi:hypothetical protein